MVEVLPSQVESSPWVKYLLPQVELSLGRVHNSLGRHLPGLSFHLSRWSSPWVAFIPLQIEVFPLQIEVFPLQVKVSLGRVHNSLSQALFGEDKLAVENSSTLKVPKKGRFPPNSLNTQLHWPAACHVNQTFSYGQPGRHRRQDRFKPYPARAQVAASSPLVSLHGRSSMNSQARSYPTTCFKCQAHLRSPAWTSHHTNIKSSRASLLKHPFAISKVHSNLQGLRPPVDTFLPPNWRKTYRLTYHQAT
ncbi:hypothetical protein FNV43_RR02047 [Rhamnella rubrinervis]|uniref:Uncharacterized protein n=1 Tax=Rhamnella rubrinervis TaxID=2594499 RepID=A0A8K0HRM1_9ROSA|nr:hypothetical protein FNV43_RR02047 [Rhamnella rubrinervis]